MVDSNKDFIILNTNQNNNNNITSFSQENINNDSFISRIYSNDKIIDKEDKSNETIKRDYYDLLARSNSNNRNQKLRLDNKNNNKDDINQKKNYEGYNSDNNKYNSKLNKHNNCANNMSNQYCTKEDISYNASDITFDLEDKNTFKNFNDNTCTSNTNNASPEINNCLYKQDSNIVDKKSEKLINFYKNKGENVDEINFKTYEDNINYDRKYKLYKHTIENECNYLYSKENNFSNNKKNKFNNNVNNNILNFTDNSNNKNLSYSKGYNSFKYVNNQSVLNYYSNDNQNEVISNDNENDVINIKYDFTDSQIEDAMENIGYGYYQIKAIILTIIVISIEGIHLTLMSSMVLPLVGFFGTTAFGIEVTAGIIFIGVGLGSLSMGYLTNKLNRKFAACFSIILILIFQFFTLITNNIFIFTICRFFLGYGIGVVVPLVLNVLCEYLPKNGRSYTLSAVWSSFAIGQALVAIFMLNLMPKFEINQVKNIFNMLWIYCFVFSLIFCLLFSDSPRNLIINNKDEEALVILKYMFKKINIPFNNELQNSLLRYFKKNKKTNSKSKDCNSSNKQKLNIKNNNNNANNEIRIETDNLTFKNGSDKNKSNFIKQDNNSNKEEISFKKENDVIKSSDRKETSTQIISENKEEHKLEDKQLTDNSLIIVKENYEPSDIGTNKLSSSISSSKGKSLKESIFKKSILKTSIILIFLWLINSILLYGPMLIYSPTMKRLHIANDENIILSIIVLASFTFASSFFIPLLTLIKEVGLKKLIIAGYIGGIIFALINLLNIERIYIWILVYSYFLGGSFNLCVTYTTCVYPTKVRDSALGFFYFCTRIGGFSSQFLFLWLFTINIMYPYYLLLILNVICLIFSFFLTIEPSNDALDISYVDS